MVKNFILKGSSISNDSFEIPKLNILEVVNEAIKLYKGNFQLLIKISFFAFLINLLSNMIDIFQYL